MKKCFIRTLAFTLFGLMNLNASSAEMDAPTAQQPLPPLAQTKLPAVVNPNLLQSLSTSAIDPTITGPVPIKK